MSEKRFKAVDGGFKHIIEDKEQRRIYLMHIYEHNQKVVDLLNEQQDQISYWKHKVSSLLWILGQFDEEKVKGLLKEMENEWYNRISDYWFNVNRIIILHSEMVRMTDEKDKEIRKLELEIRRLQMVIRLQEDIIDSYRELSTIKGSKLVVE